MAEFKIVIRGSRGTTPVAGPAFAVHGGNTACVEIPCGRRTVILDGGTGIIPLGQDLSALDAPEIDILLSHAHYDHVGGLPFFAPFFRTSARVTLWFAGCDGAASGRDVLDGLIRLPFLPFTLDDVRCDLRFGTLPQEGEVRLGDDVRVETARLNHPGGNTGLAVVREGRRLVYASDFEHDDGPCDAALVGFLAGADVALLDCTYLPEEYPAFRGFGHAHWMRCAEIAEAAGVRRWGAFHHGYTRSDADLAAMGRQIATRAPDAFVAADGMRLTV